MKDFNSKSAEVEYSLNKKYRKTIWNPFISAVKKYSLISEGDKIAVCVSGGKDSLLLAKLMQMLQRYSEFPFEVVNIAMNPGYTPANLEKIRTNAVLLGVDIKIFDADIFGYVSTVEKSPCYLCARMRRGFLYEFAAGEGCNKIALGHHLDDVVETTVMAMFYGAQLQGMPPKLKSTNHPGMQLIRPLYCVSEKDICSWRDCNGLSFLQCACKFTEKSEAFENLSKRREIKLLLKNLEKDTPLIRNNILNALHNVCLDTFCGYKSAGVRHEFDEIFGKSE